MMPTKEIARRGVRAVLLGVLVGFVLFVVIGLLTVGLPACTPVAIKDGLCRADADCGDFRFCDPSGDCRCRSDDACDASEFCNLAGSCQQALECLSDDDCQSADSPSAICDTRLSADASSGEDSLRSFTAGQCVTLNSSTRQCLLDSHCPFGFFCQATTDQGICQAGCRDNGDCGPGAPCINNACNPTPGACNASFYCEFGQVCSASNTCQDHPEAATLCERCDPGDIFNNPCPVSAGLGGPTCLIDQGVLPDECSSDAQCGADRCVRAQCLDDSYCPSGATCEGGLFGIGECSRGQCGNFFCGTSSCSETEPCPRGYSCSLLISVSGIACTLGSGSTECGGNSTCVGGGETSAQGACSCTSDNDCPPNGGGCSDPGPNGRCIIGSTCGPGDGLVCADLQ